ncbi:sulfotransferase domain-containing protein [Mumia flava]|uniref:Sulfotransferase domain-containing protein n=1 Tax=Mumia flava TaxID=1348852 RepID=A0A0B2BTU9_9ACTN|nr:sulfotransferase domain-containing protein [Mumia flava]PJJ56993.1 sulfotransferase domain-containing protein [Mumia flava]
MPDPIRYRSPDEDSARWDAFTLRPGDVVISTRSKSGTTWMQRIVSLLLLDEVEPYAPLSEISPWIDWNVEPIEDVVARLDAQPHRRFVKTHTPLDGVPIVDGVTYVVVARHPLDMAVSLFHQGANIDRVRLRALAGEPGPVPDGDAPRPRPDLHAWLLRWIASDASPTESMDGLRGVLHHVEDAWGRSEGGAAGPGEEGDVLLVHYADLRADLEQQMRRIARRLAVEVHEHRWPDLVAAASLAAMRKQASTVVPDRLGVLRDHAAFFRRGSSGAGAEALSPDELAAYSVRVAALLPPEIDAWLHRG